MKYLQLIIGIPRPFQQTDFNQSAHLISHSWIKNIWEYMPTCGVSFELTKDISNKPQRQHDRCINEILKTHFSINELSQINKIRIALQLLTLADVNFFTLE